ncbi:PREDICTED: E3 ubiquitin-protein ligase RHA2A [Fragaria vesca subsp. vesca]|uniref:E3 ubiquitin-protein ligase RHA2A n=1 Tax=Fragaria vesca subsp. vesca TaxID=101020 RepID=UPI0002C2FFFA|nr:PREDICTED: E3 ubiquitin-protein ligase RHA2A [Fragaria vesca subsp. vesca]
MGLQGQMSDLSSDSIPILLLAVVATFVSHLRSSLFSFLHSLGLCRRPDRRAPPTDDGLLTAVGSGLAGLAILAEQLNLNSLFSYRYDHSRHREGAVPDCIVCLSAMKDGDRVRMLHCRHLFHKHCFDGWLDQLNFSCPICRSPLVHEERVNQTRRRVGGDLVNWFSLRTN